jgi:hypothetical protein
MFTYWKISKNLRNILLVKKNVKFCHIFYKRVHSLTTDDDCFSTLVSLLVIRHDNTLRSDKNIAHIFSYIADKYPSQTNLN